MEINILTSLSRSKCNCKNGGCEKGMATTASASWELQGCAASLGWSHRLLHLQEWMLRCFTVHEIVPVHGGTEKVVS